MSDKLLTAADVAEFLSISATKVRLLAQQGKLKSSNLAASGSTRATYRFRKEWVEDFVDAQIIKTTTKPRQSYRSQVPQPGDRY